MNTRITSSNTTEVIHLRFLNLLCGVGIGTCDKAVACLEESYGMCLNVKNEVAWVGLGFCATEKKMFSNFWECEIGDPSRSLTEVTGLLDVRAV